MPALKDITLLKQVSGVSQVTSHGKVAAGARNYVVESKQNVRRELAKAVTDQGWRPLELRSEGISLEDVLIQ